MLATRFYNHPLGVSFGLRDTCWTFHMGSGLIMATQTTAPIGSNINDFWFVRVQGQGYRYIKVNNIESGTLGRQTNSLGKNKIPMTSSRMR